jgi:hypothetical protein
MLNTQIDTRRSARRTVTLGMFALQRRQLAKQAMRVVGLIGKRLTQD